MLVIQVYGGQFYDKSSYLTSVVTGEEVLRNDWTFIRKGRNSGLPRFVINVIANPVARWRIEKFKLP